MKPESRTAYWVIVTSGLDCSAGFGGGVHGSLPGHPHIKAPKVVHCTNCNLSQRRWISLAVMIAVARLVIFTVRGSDQQYCLRRIFVSDYDNS